MYSLYSHTLIVIIIRNGVYIKIKCVNRFGAFIYRKDYQIINKAYVKTKNVVYSMAYRRWRGLAQDTI